ncbi:MAG: adenosylcobinamide-GDP ribazoletransferase [Methanomicrobiales archaeon]|nr:adenosylcobinamide-GDP ribazoletransferase [Methanomicrobiales archaeon]
MTAIVSLLQFTTILPLGRSVDLAHFARRLYIYPVAGYVIGGIAAMLVFPLPSSPHAAAIALSTVLVLSGFHHLDGLLDFGDMMMVHGGRERRMAILADPHVGAGGFGWGMTIILISFGALLSIPSIIVAIITAEVMAKAAMACISVLGRPFREGMHHFLHKYTKKWFLLPAYFLTLPLLLLPISAIGYAITLLASILVPLLMLSLSNRILGGVNGDVVGATNEITRAVVLVALAAHQYF